MFLSKNTKILVGVLTLLPVIGIIYYFWLIFKLITSINTEFGSTPPDLNGLFGVFATLGLSFLLGLASLIFYIIHAVKNKNLDSNERLMWILLFIFVPTVSFIIYWILRIWMGTEEEKKEMSSQSFEI